jgi:hypothetical protein
MKALWLVTAVLLAVAQSQSAPAQDLGAAAEKEKARRKKAAGSATVYTNEDLEKGKPSPSPSPSPTTTTSASAPAGSHGRTRGRARSGVHPPPSAAGATRAESESESEESGGPSAPSSGGDETYWRGRSQGLRSTVADTEKQIAALEARIQQLQLDRDPASADLMDPNRLQKRDAERMKAIDELDRAKASLAAARKDLSDFEEEARRKGIPPGWIR